MNLIKVLACCAIAAGPIVSVADEPPMNNPCANIQWSRKFLAEYPRAPAGCQTVEVQNGVKYAKFSGKVVKVTANHVAVEITNVAGTPGASLDWNVKPDDEMLIHDKPEKVGDLKKGDSITFWVQEKMYKIFLAPGGKALPISNLKRIYPKS